MQRQVGDLVQEQRAAIRGLEEAVAVGFGAGERTFAVAEEFALHQVFRDRAAIHRDERLFAARAVQVDRAGRELLAAAGLAVDEHRRLALREAFDQSAHLLDRLRFAEQPVGTRRLRLLGHLQRLLDQRAQLLQRDGLGQVVERAGLQRSHGVFGAAECGDHRDRNVEALLRDVLDDAQALAVGQPHVGEAQVEGILVEQPHRLADGLRADRIQPHPRQRQLQQFEQVRFVVDDQDLRVGRVFFLP